MIPGLQNLYNSYKTPYMLQQNQYSNTPFYNGLFPNNFQNNSGNSINIYNYYNYQPGFQSQGLMQMLTGFLGIFAGLTAAKNISSSAGEIEPFDKAETMDKVDENLANADIITISAKDMPEAEFDEFIKNNIHPNELSKINPEDLAKVDSNGDPLYLIARGKHDNQYHIYKHQNKHVFKSITSVAGGNNYLYLHGKLKAEDKVGDNTAAAQKWAEYDAQWDKYKEDVDKHNDKVNEYNEKVNQYNSEAGEYNKEVDKYNKEAEEYNKITEEYNKKIEKYNREVKEYEQSTLSIIMATMFAGGGMFNPQILGLLASSEKPVKPEMPAELSSPPKIPSTVAPTAPKLVPLSEPQAPQAPEDPILEYTKVNGTNYKTGSPLILDTDKDGKVEAQHGIGVDIDGDGKADGAATGGDKMLAMGDINGNGKIDGSEVFGNETIDPFTGKKLNAANGFEALKLVALSAETKTGIKIIENGQVNVQKLKEALTLNDISLGLISDNNVTQLEGLGDISKINLSYDETEIMNPDEKVHHLQFGSYTTADNKVHKVHDVWFNLA